MTNVRWKSQVDRAVGEAVEAASNEEVACVLAQWMAILLAPERTPENGVTDPRPMNCRFRLQDEGKAYPRSACEACGKTITTGLGNSCSYRPFSDTRGQS